MTRAPGAWTAMLHGADADPVLACIASAVLIMTLAQGPMPALAHDEAEWIQKDPAYVDRFGHHCCGPQDGERIPARYVRDEGDEIHVLPTGQRFRRGERGTYASRTGDWWWCKSRQLPGYLQPPATCLFFPFHSQ